MKCLKMTKLMRWKTVSLECILRRHQRCEKNFFTKIQTPRVEGKIGKGRNLNDYENIFLWNKINELTWLMSIISVMQWHILAATGTPMEAKEVDE